MKTAKRRTPMRATALVMGMALASPAMATDAPATPPTPPTPACTTAEYRQIDFWIGDWDTFESDAPAGPSIARARITPIVQGCALHELYEQEDGLIGDSILSFDPVRRQWQQTWVPTAAR